MKKHQLTLGWWVSIACLGVSITSAQAQDTPPGPRKPNQEMPRPKQRDDGKPGAMPERRGPPELMPGDRPRIGGGHAERMRENMERREMMRAGDASVPRPFARMSDAGVRRHRPRAALSPEQLAKRKEQIEKLREKFGTELLQRRETRMELGVHAWRIARLQRMRALAEEQKKPKLVDRIDTLIKRENERHARRMDRLRAAGDAGVPGMRHPRPLPPAKSEDKTGGQP